MKAPHLLLAVVLGCSAASAIEVNARDLVRKSIANYDKDWRTGLKYTYLETDKVKRPDGSLKSVDVTQVITIDGTPYDKLVSKNGRPLTPDEQKREEDKYQKLVNTRAHESAAARAKRLRDYEQQRLFLKEVPDAFDFKLLGEEPVSGRSAYIIQCTPRPGYQPKNMKGRMFSHIKAKLWIDKQEVQWAKAEADVVDTISFGLVLARIGKGAHISLDMTRVAPNLWQFKRVDINGAAKIMMVKNRDLDEEITFSDYKPMETLAKSATSKPASKP